jgi:hypothetical protein
VASSQRGYTAGRFLVELDGSAAGFADSVEGGDVFSDVVVEQVGTDGIAHKHVAGVRYGDLVLVVRSNMSQSFLEWIASTLDRKFTRKDGAVSFQDYTGSEKERLVWQGGLLSEIRFPTVDATSKEAAHLTVKVRPELAQHKKGSGLKSQVGVNTKQTKWMESNFRLTIDGLDCTKVRAVDGMTIVQTATTNPVGEERFGEVEPAALQIPDVVVTLPEAHASDFVAWHDDFVVKGNNDDSHEKEGKLEFLSATRQEVLFTLSLHGLGIFRIAREKQATAEATVATVRAQMYCESMSFSYPAAAAAAQAQPAASSTAFASEPAAVLATALRDILAPRLAPTEAHAAELVAARLRATAGDGNVVAADGSRSGDRGRRLGASWARERATLDELEQVARTRAGDWNVLVLDDGHTLLAYLQQAGVVPETHDGPLTLERDAFVEELVEGAADVYKEVSPHLDASGVER